MLSDDFFFSLKAVVGPPASPAEGRIRLDIDLQNAPFSTSEDVGSMKNFLTRESVSRIRSVVDYLDKFLIQLEEGGDASGKYKSEIQALIDFHTVAKRNPEISGITKLEYQQNSPGTSRVSYSTKATGNGDPRPPKYP